MKLEIGKYYRTRDGRKVGPMECAGISYEPGVMRCGYVTYWGNGSVSSLKEDASDLIAEWRDAHVKDDVEDDGFVTVSASEYARAPVVTLSDYTPTEEELHDASLAKGEVYISSTDPVNQPPHYRAHPSGIECIQITEHMGFNLGNAVKYIWRCDLKAGAIEDLRKAAWYIQREIAKRVAACAGDLAQ